MVASLGLSACASVGSELSEVNEQPVSVKEIDGSDTASVTLTERAAERIDIKTTQVVEQQMAGQPRLVIPYAAVIYDAEGQAWAFTSSQPLTYIREEITVDQITGDQATLTAGPEVGTTVVTVGVAELYGAELGVGITG